MKNTIIIICIGFMCQEDTKANTESPLPGWSDFNKRDKNDKELIKYFAAWNKRVIGFASDTIGTSTKADFVSRFGVGYQKPNIIEYKSLDHSIIIDSEPIALDLYVPVPIARRILLHFDKNGKLEKIIIK